MLFLQEKTIETTKEKGAGREKPKSEEEGGVPQHYHCPYAKRREDRNPKYHEEQHKDVA
jgi:hypothetical protein